MDMIPPCQGSDAPSQSNIRIYPDTEKLGEAYRPARL